MNTFRLFFLAALLTMACSSTKNATTTSSTTNNSNSNAPDEIEAVVKAAEADHNWHLESIANSKYYGTETNRAYSELLANKTPTKKVIVAVIDSGTDIKHEDLAKNIWVNEDEIPDNGIDDDNNGYIDDIHGWNFIGGKNGENVNKDSYEVSRLYKELSAKYADSDSATMAGDEEYELYLKVKADYNTKRNNALDAYDQLSNVKNAVNWAKTQLKISSLDSVDNAKIKVSNYDSPMLKQAKEIITFFTEKDINEEDIENEYNHYKDQVEYSYNEEFDPRHIVGDDYRDLTNRYYGNNDVTGPRSDHGTHVAGIIGAVRNNELGMDGIADNISLMIVRTVPDGDERDKDVANAVRYAVENGADVINMSFGKGYSPQKEYVDSAFKFADEQGVLVIHSAGNDGNNIDSVYTYPNKFYTDGGWSKNFITVGASSWKESSDSTLAASFSNYGKTVDIFAPGVDVYSTYPNNEYEKASGTSMAGPVVTGVAALIMSYYPELTASDVKEILLQSATKINNTLVYKPGSKDVVDFSSLSATGGIVNAYEALKLAEIRAMGTK